MRLTYLKKEIFRDLFQYVILNKQEGYEENRREENVLSKWKYSCETGICSFLQEKELFSYGEGLYLERVGI